jgi:hypothetical protein
MPTIDAPFKALVSRGFRCAAASPPAIFTPSRQPITFMIASAAFEKLRLVADSSPPSIFSFTQIAADAGFRRRMSGFISSAFSEMILTCLAPLSHCSRLRLISLRRRPFQHCLRYATLTMHEITPPHFAMADAIFSLMHYAHAACRHAAILQRA